MFNSLCHLQDSSHPFASPSPSPLKRPNLKNPKATSCDPQQHQYNDQHNDPPTAERASLFLPVPIEPGVPIVLLADAQIGDGLTMGRVCLWSGTYVCFIAGLCLSFGVDVHVDEALVSVSLLGTPFSSSMWTAAEKRFQKAGSRTPVIVSVVIWCGSALFWFASDLTVVWEERILRFLAAQLVEFGCVMRL